jgi:hypothetical protein
MEDPARYAELTQIRLHHPEEIERAARARRGFDGLAPGEQIFIIAADHTARGASSVGSQIGVMADRRQLLDRLLIALSNPGCRGVLASPEILDDLLLLGALDGKLVIGSVNRAGLAGASFEVDDRRTGHTARGVDERRFDGGKILCRVSLDDPATPGRLEATAQAVDQFASRRLIAMLEPFMARWEEGRLTNLLDPDSVAAAIQIVSALGSSSAYTWLKVPCVDDMERVMRATTLPAVLLGGDTGEDLDEVLTQWSAALRLPGVVGLTVGRRLLYPDDGDVAGAVGAAVGILDR